MKLSLADLSQQSGVAERNIRFYIAKGLVDRPEGEKRGAWYTATHLEQLLRVRQWRESGLSLDAIADLLASRGTAPRPTPRPGSLEVRSHLLVAEGVELSVSPERSGLTSRQVRELFRAVRQAHARIAGADSEPEENDDDQD